MLRGTHLEQIELNFSLYLVSIIPNKIRYNQINTYLYSIQLLIRHIFSKRSMQYLLQLLKSKQNDNCDKKITDGLGGFCAVSFTQLP